MAAASHDPAARLAVPQDVGPARPVPGTYLVTAVRNEAPFLVEWIAYHKVIGFENIIVFANPSTDGTDELLAGLAGAGEITHVPHDPPPGVSAQANAARLVNEGDHVPEGGWVIWLDADEFLNIHVGQGHLDDLLAVLADKAGLLISWRVFGDGGNERFAGRFLSPAFVQAAEPAYWENLQVKTFFRKGPDIPGFGRDGIHRPLLAKGNGLDLSSILTGTGRGLVPWQANERWLSGEAWDQTVGVAPQEHGYDIAQINHYSVRTPEHFLLKRLRGRGWLAGMAGAANRRHKPQGYLSMNRNEAEERSILRFEKACTAEMDRLFALPGIRGLHEDACRRVEEQIAQLPRGQLARMQQAARAKRNSEHEPSFTLTLPEDEARALSQAYGQASVILEYGSGGSTFLALQSGAEFVMSVESDKEWVGNISARLRGAFRQERFLVHHADIGPTLSWGRPAGAAAFRRFHLYATDIWDHPRFRHPDVVLIDGRFRVACFLATMIRCTRPVTVLFDDYIDRDYYHWIEELIPRDEMMGRMAKFTVRPTHLPPEQLTRCAGAFADPR